MGEKEEKRGRGRCHEKLKQAKGKRRQIEEEKRDCELHSEGRKGEGKRTAKTREEKRGKREKLSFILSSTLASTHIDFEEMLQNPYTQI